MNNTAIVIPTLGNPLNKAWIESVVSTIKVIVVCDGDDDLAIEGVTQIFSNRQGFSGAVNMGIRQAQQEGHQSVLVLNDDAIPEPGCIERLISEYVPEMGLLSPMIVEKDSVILGYNRSKWGRFRHAQNSKHAQYLPAVCLLMPSWARFDERYVHGFEDFELCRRFRQMGLPVRIESGLRCFHHGGATLDRKSAAAQYGSSYGQLLFEGLRWSPMVLLLQCAHVFREGRDIARFGAVCRAAFDYYWLRAVAMASPRAGSSKAK